MSSIEEIKNKVESGSTKITTDNPLVEQTKIITEAVKMLSDDKNEIFSNHIVKPFLGLDESLNFALAYEFADNPLSDIEQQVRRVCKNDNYRIDIPVIKDFTIEWLRRRHSGNRKRVEEFTKALENIGSRNTFRPMMTAGEGGTEQVRRRLL